MEHTCSDTCFNSRTAKKLKVNCFGCLKASNMHCFSITDNSVLKLISISSNAVFICTKCSDRIVKLRAPKSNRLSTDSSVKRQSTAPSIDRPLEAHVAVNPNSFSQLTNFFEMITEKLSKLEAKIDNQAVEQSNETLIKTNSQIAHPETTTNTIDSAVNDTLNNIYKVLLKTSDNINKLHSQENEKDSLQKITNLLDKNCNNTTTTTLAKKQTNFLDWSMHDSYINNAPDDTVGRQSLIVKQSVDDDVMKILKSSDETTWFTLDVIIKKLNDHGLKLDSLLSMNRLNGELGDEAVSVTSAQRSPLMEAIHMSSNDSLCIHSNTLTNTIDISDSNEHNNDSIKHKNNTMSDITHSHTNDSVIFENQTIMSKQKEAMSHLNNNEYVPETSKQQKRLKPNSSDCRLNKIDSSAPTQELINNETVQMSSVENEALCALESLASNEFNINTLSHFYNTEQTKCAGASVINFDLHLDDSLSTENPTVMRKRKEVMTHHNTIKNVPEPFKQQMQKRQMPIASVCRLDCRSNKNDTEINFVDLPLNNSFDIQLDTDTGRNNDLPSTSSSLTEVRNCAQDLPNPTEIHQNLASVHRSMEKINEFHLSRLMPTTTCQMVIDFMTRRGVPESLMKEVKVWPLTPKDRDPSTFSFVSFKIDAFADVANIINRINFWPSSTIFKNFVHRSKTRTRTIADLSLNCNDSDFPEMGKPKAQHRINSNISSMSTV